MSAQFTPGPWRVDAGGFNVVLDKPSGPTVAVTQPHAHAKDHARLIAAAPELLEALEPFVSGAGHTMTFLRTREKMHATGQELYLEDVRRARAAIAKATGAA
jgi:hypothetical protein